MTIFENLPPPLKEAVSVMPERVRVALFALLSGLRGASGEISEIRLRGLGGSFAIIGQRRIPLAVRLEPSELEEILARLCRDSLYAYRDSISRGYVTMDYGVRVGIAGMARYDGGKIVGVSHPSSLVFRIPTGRCDFGEKLYYGWLNLGMPNLIVTSRPGVGKTTALRSLVGYAGSGEEGVRVVVVDERCEFISEDYSGCTVDILRGYRRAEGIDIALRTLSPQLLAVDEVGSREECEALLYAVSAGVKIIASAHGEGAHSLECRPEISRLIKSGGFSALAVITELGGRREAVLTELRAEVTV